jgi:hypothetical protein
VILNSHKDGCDAILLPNHTSDPLHVALPAVTLDLLTSQKIFLNKLLGRCSARNAEDSVSSRLLGCQEIFKSRSIEECFTDLLAWLWTNVVEPVYEMLASVSPHKSY